MIQPEMMKQKIFCWLQFVGAPRRSEAGLHAASSRQECSKLAAMFLCTMLVHFSFNFVPTPFNQFNAATANQNSVVPSKKINTQFAQTPSPCYRGCCKIHSTPHLNRWQRHSGVQLPLALHAWFVRSLTERLFRKELARRTIEASPGLEHLAGTVLSQTRQWQAQRTLTCGAPS